MKYVVTTVYHLNQYLAEIPDKQVINIDYDIVDEFSDEHKKAATGLVVITITDEAASFLKMKDSFVKPMNMNELKKRFGK